MGISERLFYLKVQELTGTSPSQYLKLKERRLQKAYNLLESGACEKVKDAAAEAGFLAVKHFSRLFAKRFGQRPSSILAAKKLK